MKKILWLLVILISVIFLLPACEKSKDDTTTQVAQQAGGKDYIYVPVSNSLHIIDGETDTVIKKIPYDAYIIGGAFSPDGKRYYLNAMHSVLVIDTVSQELVDTFKFSSKLSKVNVAGIAISNDNKLLYITCAIVKKKQNVPKLNLLPPQLIVFDLESKKIVKSYEVPFNTKSIFPLKDDPDHLLLSGYDFQKINLKTGKLEVAKRMFNVPEGEDPKLYLPANESSAPGDHGINIFGYIAGEGLDLRIGYIFVDRNQGTIRTMDGDDLWFAYNQILSNDKKHIFTVMDELVKIDADSGKTVAWVPTETGTCYSVALSSNGKKVYVGPGGADISVYDTETLKLLKVIPLSADGPVMHRLTL